MDNSDPKDRKKGKGSTIAPFHHGNDDVFWDEFLTYTEEEMAFLTECFTGENSDIHVLEEEDCSTSGFQPGWSDCLNTTTNLHAYSGDIWPGDIAIQQNSNSAYSDSEFLHPSSMVPKLPLSPSYNDTTLDEFISSELSIISSLEMATGSSLGYLSTEILPSISSTDGELLLGTISAPIEIPDSPIRENLLSQDERSWSSNEEISHPSSTIPELPLFPSYNDTTLDEFTSSELPIISSFSAMATGSNLGYLSTELLPYISAPDGKLLLGTISAPIEIPDSPVRENSPSQDESRSSNKQKRAREPESEVEVMSSSAFNNIKKIKKLHESQNLNIGRPPTSSVASFTVSESTSLPQRNAKELPSIQNNSDSTKCPSGCDNIDHAAGRFYISQGTDLILEELLRTTAVQESSDHSCSELGLMLMDELKS